VTDTPKRPEGYPVLAPYFTVTGADRLISFLCDVFGATILKETRHPDGTVQHARLRLGDVVIMLNEATEGYQSQVSQMHLFVSDVEATYHNALATGAASLMTPNIRPHGDRMAGITDPCGNIWWLASHVPASG
jgi:uncharacterized glyoxalase superfamily protein PhnB